MDNIDAWLKCHLAMVLPLCGALYAAGTDNYRLARTHGLIRMMKRGMKEAVSVLRTLDYAIIPKRLARAASIPDFLFIKAFGRQLATKEAEIGLAGHAWAARTEIAYLASEFRQLIEESTATTPHLDYLLGFIDPSKPLVDEGADFKAIPA
jgi:2-dehydropantoate 2-reductase